MTFDRDEPPFPTPEDYGYEYCDAPFSEPFRGANSSTRDEDRREVQKAENARVQNTEILPITPSMTVGEMIEDAVWLGDGAFVGLISDPRQVLTFGDFAGLTAASVTTNFTAEGKKKVTPNAMIWKQSPERKTVLTRTFHAGAAAICRDPEGKLALNSWRPIVRTESKRDIAPFLEQLGYLFPDAIERAVFLDWLAHIEQRPGEIASYAWLHIASNTGTGRNWLASVLARVWRGYVAPNVDLPALLDSSFNGQIASRVLAIVDEVQEGGGENQYRHANRLKSLVNAEYRDINPKFGRRYYEHNSCRWLVFSNHDNALPLNDTDRRWRVVKHVEAPRSAEEYARLYVMLNDPEFINSVGVYLAQRDISAFNPGERPPLSSDKLGALSAAKSMPQKYAEDLVANWPSDIITNNDIAEILSDGAVQVMTSAMRRAMEEAGATSAGRTIYVGGTRRIWVLRNKDKWNSASTHQVTDECVAARKNDAMAPALDVLRQNSTR